ncbi:hypothetical protein BDV10DRAFT_180227 [Aspergillus recurvatus]
MVLVYLEGPARTNKTDLQKRDNIEEDAHTPIFEPPPFAPPLQHRVNSLPDQHRELLTSSNTWLVHRRGDIIGRWYPFPKEKTAGGSTRLYGCTAVMIVSHKREYVSHIYERTSSWSSSIGVKWGRVMPAPEEFFRKASYNTLTNGVDDPDSELIDPIKGQPARSRTQGPCTILTRRRSPSSRPSSTAPYLYPSESSPAAPEEPSEIGYKTASRNIAGGAASLQGKAIMEATQIDHYEKREGEPLIRAIGRWRLWVNGKEAVSRLFESDQNQRSKSEVERPRRWLLRGGRYTERNVAHMAESIGLAAAALA